MSASIVMGGVVEFIELHDARVGRVTVDVEGAVEIALSTISVFVRTRDVSECWSFQATIECRGASGIEIIGVLAAQDYVSDGRFVSSSGKEIELIDACEHAVAADLDLMFACNAARFRVRGGTLQLRLGNRVRKLEDAEP